MHIVVNHKLWWHLARASGLVAWALLATSVSWGLIVSGRLTRKVPPPAWNLDLHRFLGGLAVAFTTAHLSGLVLDRYVHFGLAELFVPLASRWKPGPVAWGVVSVYLMVAIYVSSLLMRRLPRRLWRGIHSTSFVLWAFATVHALLAGTDTGNPIVRWSALAVAAVAACLGLLRLVVPNVRAARRRPSVPPSQAMDATRQPKPSPQSRRHSGVYVEARGPDVAHRGRSADSRRPHPGHAVARTPGDRRRSGPSGIAGDRVRRAGHRDS